MDFMSHFSSYTTSILKISFSHLFLTCIKCIYQFGCFQFVRQTTGCDPVAVDIGFRTPFLENHFGIEFVCSSHVNTLIYDLATYYNRLNTCLVPTTTLMVTLLRRTLGRSRRRVVFELYRIPTLSNGISVLLRLCVVIYIVCRSLNGLVLVWYGVFPSNLP